MEDAWLEGSPCLTMAYFRRRSFSIAHFACFCALCTLLCGVGGVIAIIGRNASLPDTVLVPAVTCAWWEDMDGGAVRHCGACRTGGLVIALYFYLLLSRNTFPLLSAAYARRARRCAASASLPGAGFAGQQAKTTSDTCYVGVYCYM